MKMMMILLLVPILAGIMEAKVITRPVVYHDGDTELHGYLAWDDAVTTRRPGVLVVHEWWGLNDFTREKTRELARLGYVAFAADMYGNGKTTRNPKEAAEWSTKLYGSPLLRERVRLALDQLAGDPHTDSAHLAAIGFCFGGTTALQLAYSGASLAGVVSFHGSLPLPDAADRGRIKARVLILHGAADPFTSPADLATFEKTLDQANVDWEMVIYANAEHSFTNPDADTYKIPGVAYNARAAKRAWRQMKLFLTEVLQTDH